jgi:hypothetical protein
MSKRPSAAFSDGWTSCGPEYVIRNAALSTHAYAAGDIHIRIYVVGADDRMCAKKDYISITHNGAPMKQHYQRLVPDICEIGRSLPHVYAFFFTIERVCDEKILPGSVSYHIGVAVKDY